MEKNNKKKISIIIPYHNEEKNIIKTIKKIQKQSYKNFEVLLINSSSTDTSFQIINNYIKTNKLKKFSNFNENTIYPSDSKNLGIKKAKNKFIAFMDCGLSFDKNWLYNQVSFIEKNKLDFTVGILHTEAKNSFDAAVISQTWGLNKKIPVIPGSLFNKKIFIKLGMFKVSRAGYDKMWLQNLNKKYKIRKNKKISIKYDLDIHGKNYINLFKKIFNYSYHSSKFFYKKSLLYLSMPFVFIFLSFLFSPFFPLFLYLILRIIFPLMKCNNIFDILSFNILIKLLPVAIVLDVSRFLGYLKKNLNNIF